MSNAISECTIDKFDELDAYLSPDILYQYFESIILLKVDHNIQYTFNKDLLVDSLERYIEGKSPTGLDYIPYGYEPYKLTFGSNVLKVYKEKIKGCSGINPRPLYLMKMHKEMMRDRLQYLVEKQYLQRNISECIAENNELIQLFTQIMMLSLKYNATFINEDRVAHLEELITLAMNKDIDSTKLILGSLK